MIRRMGKIMLLFLSVITVVLFIVMFFFSLAGDDTIGTYNISVLVNVPSERFTRGVQQAALDYNVDIHMVSGYSGSEQQLQYLQRELVNGANAAVVQPEDVPETEEFLEGLYPNATIVTVGQKLDNSELSLYVGTDDTQLGQEIGELIAANAAGKRCLIICPAYEKSYISERREGLKSVLSEKEIPFEVMYSVEEYINIAKYTNYTGGVAIAVLDESMLVPFCERSRERDVLFGIGYLSGVRPHLESGRIKNLVVYSEYDMGYLSVREAVNKIENKNVKEIRLDSYIVDSDTMYEFPLVQILFPIG